MAAMFTFALDPVLEWKRLNEHRLQEDVAAAVRQEQSECDELAQLQHEERDYLRALHALLNSHPLDLSAILELETHLTHLADAIRQQLAQLELIAASLAEARERLTAAAKETESIERLRNRKLEQHRHHQDRLEEQRLGEMAIERHVRRMRATK